MSDETEIEDRELHASLENVLRKLIDDLFTHLPDEVIPQKEVVEKTEDQFVSTYAPDYLDLMTTYTEHWTGYAEYSQCVDAFMGSHVYTEESVLSFVNDAESREHLARVVVPRFSARYFERKKALEFDEDVFKGVYLEFENYLERDTVTFRSWTLLSNFGMNIEELELEDNLRLRRVTPEERSKVKDSISTGSLSRFDLMDDFLIEAEFELSKNPDGLIQLSEGQEDFEAVMLALRLFDGGGDVRHKSIFTEQYPVNYSDLGTKTSSNETRHGVLSERCNLDREGAERFKEFWTRNQSYFQLEESESISAPLRRFTQMDEKSTVEDALIDSVIAFESTLLEEVSHGESYRFRMPIRASLLIDERSEHDRDFIYHFFRELYDTRSAIVHRGSKITDTEIEDQEMNPKEFTLQARDFLRQVLLEYIQRIEQGQNIQHVNQEIDQALRGADYPFEG